MESLIYRLCVENIRKMKETRNKQSEEQKKPHTNVKPNLFHKIFPKYEKESTQKTIGERYNILFEKTNKEIENLQKEMGGFDSNSLEYYDYIKEQINEKEDLSRFEEIKKIYGGTIEKVFGEYKRVKTSLNKKQKFLKIIEKNQKNYQDVKNQNKDSIYIRREGKISLGKKSKDPYEFYSLISPYKNMVYSSHPREELKIFSKEGLNIFLEQIIKNACVQKGFNESKVLIGNEYLKKELRKNKKDLKELVYMYNENLNTPYRT